MKKILVIVSMILWDYIVSLIGLGNFSGVMDVSNAEISLSIKDTINMFMSLLTFQVEGIPAIVSILLIYLPNLALFLVLIFIIFNRGD